MNDNQPDDWQPWQRAVWLLHARHGLVHNEKIGEEGIQGNPAEIPVAAIRELLVDLMHYCHERNKYVGEADAVDLFELVMSAEDDFLLQRDGMPEEELRLRQDHPEPQPSDDFKAQLAKDSIIELAWNQFADRIGLHVRQEVQSEKLGRSPRLDRLHHRQDLEQELVFEKQRDATIRKEANHWMDEGKADPDFEKLFYDLGRRQFKEATALFEKSGIGSDKGLSGADMRAHRQEVYGLIDRFLEERERYEAEYRETRKIGAQMNADEKPKSFDFNQLLDDGPKFSK